MSQPRVFDQPTAKTAPGQRDPAEQPGPWPGLVILGLVVAGVLSPLVCFGAALAAFGFGDRDQSTLLAGAGLAYVLMGLTLFAGA